MSPHGETSKKAAGSGKGTRTGYARLWLRIETWKGFFRGFGEKTDQPSRAFLPRLRDAGV